MCVFGPFALKKWTSDDDDGDEAASDADTAADAAVCRQSSSVLVTDALCTLHSLTERSSSRGAVGSVTARGSARRMARDEHKRLVSKAVGRQSRQTSERYVRRRSAVFLQGTLATCCGRDLPDTFEDIFCLTVLISHRLVVDN